MVVKVKVLVRDNEKAEKLKALYPFVIPIIGSLDDVGVIEAVAGEVGVVVNAADCDHIGAISAIIRGLNKHPENAFFIHTSGVASILDSAAGAFMGEKIWDDVTDIEELTALPGGTIHYESDKLVRSACSTIKVAIVSPPAAYGVSPSPWHPTWLALPLLLSVARGLSSGFTVSIGANITSYVHVKDLAQLYVRLLSYAVGSNKDRSQVGDLDVWGPQAYYLAFSEEVSFAESMASLVPVLKQKGVIQDESIKQLSAEDVAGLDGSGMLGIAFGTNERVRSTRAKILGWKPQQPDVRSTWAEVITRYLEEEQRRKIE
ncbi:MAG: hypothetical protein M1834_003857 [Cirrosporium novae-zelandiae]|nr:MAG: hypothetical protein M1834_003857 [Cirrosporium novae-zelandiae]